MRRKIGVLVGTPIRGLLFVSEFTCSGHESVDESASERDDNVAAYRPNDSFADVGSDFLDDRAGDDGEVFEGYELAHG